MKSQELPNAAKKLKMNIAKNVIKHDVFHKVEISNISESTSEYH